MAKVSWECHRKGEIIRILLNYLVLFKTLMCVWQGITRTNAHLEVKTDLIMILFRAAEIIMHTGSVVTLETLKSAAAYYGFEGVFTQPTQTTSKGSKYYAHLITIIMHEPFETLQLKISHVRAMFVQPIYNLWLLNICMLLFHVC